MKSPLRKKYNHVLCKVGKKVKPAKSIRSATKNEQADKRAKWTRPFCFRQHKGHLDDLRKRVMDD